MFDRTLVVGIVNTCVVVTIRLSTRFDRSAISSRVVRSPSTPKVRSSLHRASTSEASTSAMSMIWPWFVTTAMLIPSFINPW